MERYAVVSCHVERPLDDEVWFRFEALQRRRPGGFPIAALMRPPDGATEAHAAPRWLERARLAAGLAPLGLHTHWTAPDHARPLPDADTAGLVRSQLEWLAEEGLAPRLFAGGGWYSDPAVAAVVAAAGLIDCTPTSFRPIYLAQDAPRLTLAAPALVQLPSGAALTAVPSTRSIGMLVRALAPRGVLAEPVVHVYFHDTDLLDRRRVAGLRLGLALLARRRHPCTHPELIPRLGELPRVPLADCLEPAPERAPRPTGERPG